MATFHSIFTSCGRAILLAAACVVVPLTASEPIAGTAVAERERSRRNTAIEEARELLRKGDEVYQAGRYAEALEAYAGARDLLPDARISAELRAAATQRYVQASIEHARVLSRNGDVAGAKAAVDKVLRDDVAPNDAQALALRAQLDDPIRTNPALTAGHAKNVDAVRRLLYTAGGAYDLGKFDEARTHYEEVLRIDPSNTAARRGMEKVAATKSNYHKAAYDHTRAEMLSQVGAAWELQVPAPELGAGPADPGAAAADTGKVTVAAKLDRIIIPKVAFDQISLEEAVDYLRSTTRTVDLGGTDSEYVNFTVNLGQPDSEIAKRIRALTSFTTDEFSVIIAPAGFTSDELMTRSYRVPPDFITSLSSGAKTPEASADPFATSTAKEGLLTKRLSAQEALTQQGVLFPEGASATYSASTNILRVVNTATNQDFISQAVEAMTKTEPVLVSVRVTMIKTQQTNLKELGFDWLVSPFAVNGANSMFASGGTVGNTTGRTGADFISPVDGTPISGVPTIPAVPVNSGVVTNGLRSGSHATNSSSLDEMINNPYRDVQRSSVAPGILAVTGLFSDSQVQMVMRGLDQKKGVDIMAQPSTVTRSGQSSKIEIIREFIYPTEYEPPQIPQSVGLRTGGGFPITPSSPTAFETKNVGITLEVLPVADANKRFVDITLNPSLSDFDGFVNYGSPINSIVTSPLGGSRTEELTQNTILMPIFSVQRLSTQLSVTDGSTIALGGLMSERIQNVQDKVPIIGNIPVLGRLPNNRSPPPSSSWSTSNSLIPPDVPIGIVDLFLTSPFLEIPLTCLPPVSRKNIPSTK
ncbi:MAG: type II and III secretion system protein [Verrucomicrobia bacterium]|nr:type II and III secretion system protein [Verrucomicrobiota bacterium]